LGEQPVGDLAVMRLAGARAEPDQKLCAFTTTWFLFVRPPRD
jgi:hypothetical protein